MAKLLKDETVAVASFGDQPPNPLHLRIFKEGTLVFILPPPPPKAIPIPGGLPLPEGDEALLPGLGMVGLVPRAVSVRVWLSSAMAAEAV